jgi:aconitase B
LHHQAVQRVDRRIPAVEHHPAALDDRRRLRRCAYPGASCSSDGSLAGQPELLEADADAEYAEVIEIDLADVKEPVLCAPNDPDDARLLSSVAGEKIDEVFIGSCMTNIGHFRAAGKLLEQVKVSCLPVCGCRRRPRWTLTN